MFCSGICSMIVVEDSALQRKVEIVELQLFLCVFQVQTMFLLNT